MEEKVGLRLTFPVRFSMEFLHFWTLYWSLVGFAKCVKNHACEQVMIKFQGLGCSAVVDCLPATPFELLQRLEGVAGCEFVFETACSAVAGWAISAGQHPHKVMAWGCFQLQFLDKMLLVFEDNKYVVEATLSLLKQKSLCIV